MRLVLIGISHRSAPIELREKVTLALEEAGALARKLAGNGTQEAVCLSTCNRTEIYLAADEAGQAEEAALEALAQAGGLPEAELGPTLYRLRDDAAAIHLFRVASGLDSLVPGEGEILGQVKTAYEAGAAGSVLDRVFREALQVGKRVRTETAIGENPASVSSAAAALAQQVFGELEGRRALVVGAGEIGSLAARSLVTRGAQITYVVSRSSEPAEELSRRFGGDVITLERLPDALVEVDMVVSSTSAPHPIIDRELVEHALRARRGRPLFLIDLAVPRDVDPAVNQLEDCYLYNVDDLQAVVAETLGARRDEGARAEQMVAEQAAKFREWQASLEVVPAIQSLRAWAEDVRLGELDRAGGKLAELSDEQRQAVEALTAQLVNKLLHEPTVRLKQAATGSDGVNYADTVRHLFGLGEEER